MTSSLSVVAEECVQQWSEKAHPLVTQWGDLSAQGRAHLFQLLDVYPIPNAFACLEWLCDSAPDSCVKAYMQERPQIRKQWAQSYSATGEQNAVMLLISQNKHQLYRSLASDFHMEWKDYRGRNALFGLYSSSSFRHAEHNHKSSVAALYAWLRAQHLMAKHIFKHKDISQLLYSSAWNGQTAMEAISHNFAQMAPTISALNDAGANESFQQEHAWVQRSMLEHATKSAAQKFPKSARSIM